MNANKFAEINWMNEIPSIKMCVLNVDDTNHRKKESERGKKIVCTIYTGTKHSAKSVNISHTFSISFGDFCHFICTRHGNNLHFHSFSTDFLNFSLNFECSPCLRQLLRSGMASKWKRKQKRKRLNLKSICLALQPPPRCGTRNFSGFMKNWKFFIVQRTRCWRLNWHMNHHYFIDALILLWHWKWVHWNWMARTLPFYEDHFNVWWLFGWQIQRKCARDHKKRQSKDESRVTLNW